MRPGGPGPHGRASSFEHNDGFLLRHALRYLGKRPAILQIFDVHGDDLRVGILLEERQQVVFVNIRLIPQADDSRYPHLGRTAKANDAHATATPWGGGGNSASFS